MTAPETLRSPWAKVAAAVGMLTAIISIVLVAFAWPSARSSVHDVPVAVVGSAAQVQRVSSALEQRAPGMFDLVPARDSAAAEDLVLDRSVYGAIDVSGAEPTVLTASAASPVIAQTLQGVAAGLGAEPATPGVMVRDLAPLPSDDPRGAGLAAGALPLVMGGMIAAALLPLLVIGAARRIAGALAFAVSGGLAMAAILQFWLGSIEGPYLANARVIALAVASISLAILGLRSLFGTPGLALGGVLMMLVGNPLSGMSSAPEMLPGWSGDFGQLLPPGAAGTLLRSTAFFDGHGSAAPVITLLVWVAAGLALNFAGARKAAAQAVIEEQVERVPAMA